MILPLLVLAESLLALPLIALALLSRVSTRRIDVGLGPEPLINNVYHARALQKVGRKAETFVHDVYYITRAFEYRLKERPIAGKLPRPLGAAWLFVRAVFRYRVLFLYVNGGPLYGTLLLKHLEPRLYKLAGVRTVVMPYGSDVQDLTRSRNLAFVDAMSRDYPRQGSRWHKVAASIDRWTRHADWVISGCEWVDYMYQWNTLMLAHFSIDVDAWKPPSTPRREGPFRVLHAPNHRAIKGTASLVAAVERLKAEGHDIELVLLERVSNETVREAMEDADLVADQFVVGWYAMFAIEAMALEKPVLCYLRPDLVDLYRKVGLLRPGDPPLIDTPQLEIAGRLRWCLEHRDELPEIGRRGRRYVVENHSLERIGREFEQILEAVA